MVVGGCICAGMKGKRVTIIWVPAIIERITVDWAVASELPRVLWFEKDMGGMA